MADPSKTQRVTEMDDPNRCQSVGNKGQCQIFALPGSRFCFAHAGNFETAQNNEAVRNLRLTKWRGRVGELADNPQVKSLREEIGILRVMLEETVNRCTDANELILFSNKISDLVTKIEKLVVSCHRLEEKTGSLLDRTAALHLGSAIVDIISREITDEAMLDRISEKIAEVVLITPAKEVA